MPSVAIYFYVNLSPYVRQKSAKIFRTKTTHSCIVSLSLKANIISGIIRLLFCMKFFSNLRFPSIDIDVVNNNESNRKQTPPFCCMFRAQTSLHLVKLMAAKVLFISFSLN